MVFVVPVHRPSAERASHNFGKAERLSLTAAARAHSSSVGAWRRTHSIGVDTEGRVAALGPPDGFLLFFPLQTLAGQENGAIEGIR